MSVDTALSLDGSGRLDYALKQGPKRDLLLGRALQGAAPDPSAPSRLEVKFRTRGKSGTLLHVQESSDYTTVKVHAPVHSKILKNSKLMFTHSLIPVNTHPGGDQTPWKPLGRWERLECLLAWKLL